MNNRTKLTDSVVDTSILKHSRTKGPDAGEHEEYIVPLLRTLSWCVLMDKQHIQ